MVFMHYFLRAALERLKTKWLADLRDAARGPPRRNPRQLATTTLPRDSVASTGAWINNGDGDEEWNIHSIYCTAACQTMFTGKIPGRPWLIETQTAQQLITYSSDTHVWLFTCPLFKAARLQRTKARLALPTLMPSTTWTLSSFGAPERSNQKWLRTTQDSELVTQKKKRDIPRWLISSNGSHLLLFFFLICFDIRLSGHSVPCHWDWSKTTGIHLSHRCGSNLCLQALEVNSDRLKQWLCWLLTGASSESRPKETAASLETACQLTCRLIGKESCTGGATTYLIMAIVWRWNGTLGGLSCFFAVKTWALFVKKKKKPFK